MSGFVVDGGQQQPDGRGSSALSPLLRSKLRPPSIPDYFVTCPRLNDLLDTSMEVPLTLIVSPAGSGKTQLVANWLDTRSVASGWLSLEEMDADPVELWRGLIAAVEQVAPSSGVRARELLMRPAPVSTVVRALLDDLESSHGAPCMLVVDDVHLLGADAGSSLSFFAQHLPAWLHIILIGRVEPDLPLHRLRVRGQVAELRFAELRFSASEAFDMLARLAPGLTAAELEDMSQRTGGWAAGLQLTALVSRSTTAQHATVGPRTDGRLLIEEYMWHEVLAAGDPEVVGVLLAISVVDRVDASLAAAITDRADAGDLLLRGEAQGLFVYRIGPNRWFRMHALVRELLHAELIRQSRHTVHHERAAQWFEDAGEVVEALEQWMLADRPREALRLVAARSTELYDRGREATIVRTIEAIPHHVATADLSARIDYAVSQILVSRVKFVDAVREATWSAERSERVDATGQIAALQSVALVTQGSWTLAGSLAHVAIPQLGSGWSTDPAGRFVWNTLARSVALSEGWDDTSAVIRDATMAMSGDPGRRLSLQGIRVLGEALGGRPVESLRLAAALHDAAARMSILRSELAIADAVARRELGDRSALTRLEELADAPDELRLYCPVLAMLELVAARVDEGDVAAAAREFERAQIMVSEANGGSDLQQWLRRVGTVVALARGETDEARQWAGFIDDAFWKPVSHARVALFSGDRQSAREFLVHAVPRCIRHDVILSLLLARAAAGDDAVVHASRAVELASEHGLIQTVVADGRDVIEMIERAAWRVSGDWLHRIRLAVASRAVPSNTSAPHLVEPLTDREREVLQLLPSRLTLGEVASELGVSVNTLKFHLRVIYRKLGVNSREEAATIARTLTTRVRTVWAGDGATGRARRSHPVADALET